MTVAHVVTVDAPELAPVIEQLAVIAAAHGARAVHNGVNTAPAEYAGAAALAVVAIFDDRTALNAYLEDPSHLAAASSLGGAVVSVIDLEGATGPAPQSSPKRGINV